MNTALQETTEIPKNPIKADSNSSPAEVIYKDDEEARDLSNIAASTGEAMGQRVELKDIMPVEGHDVLDNATKKTVEELAETVIVPKLNRRQKLAEKIKNTADVLRRLIPKVGHIEIAKDSRDFIDKVVEREELKKAA